MNIKTFRIGGIHPTDNKLTAELVTRTANLPSFAIFPLTQHIGSPAIPVVKRGDRVKVGTMLAESTCNVSAHIYSSVSGIVVKVGEKVFDATGYRQPAIIVEVEGDDWEEYIDRSDKLETVDNHQELNSDKIIELIKNAGITGMGGAGFPTHVKLSPPNGIKIHYVIINAVECEPYITSDYRLMMEHADEILEGVKLLIKATKAKCSYIGIETNKLKAIRNFEEKCKENNLIEIVPLKQKYPQGGEKQLVDAVLNRQIPSPPAIPANVGTVVINIGTVFAIYQAVMKKKPLFERYTTVSGKHIKNPGNFLVRLGTPVSQLIEQCGGLPNCNNKIIAGGPMMGKALVSDQVPICKGTNCITVLSESEAVRVSPKPCIRCAKCVQACPMGLEPYLLAVNSSLHNWEKLEDNNIISCIECGSCQYVCPSYRPILDNVRIGKSAVIGILKKRNIK